MTGQRAQLADTPGRQVPYQGRDYCSMSDRTRLSWETTCYYQSSHTLYIHTYAVCSLSTMQDRLAQYPLTHSFLVFDQHLLTLWWQIMFQDGLTPNNKLVLSWYCILDFDMILWRVLIVTTSYHGCFLWGWCWWDHSEISLWHKFHPALPFRNGLVVGALGFVCVGSAARHFDIVSIHTSDIIPSVIFPKKK